MNRTTLLLSLLLLTMPVSADDSPIASLDELLTPIIRKYYPDAQIEVTDTSYVAKHGTKDFTVHGHKKTGEISAKPHIEEGPNYQGFLLRVNLEDSVFVSQAKIPQELHQVYWTVFFDASAIPGLNQFLRIRFSYGNRLNPEFKKALLDALPKSRGINQP